LGLEGGRSNNKNEEKRLQSGQVRLAEHQCQAINAHGVRRISLCNRRLAKIAATVEFTVLRRGCTYHGYSPFDQRVYRANQQNPKFRANEFSRLRSLWLKPFDQRLILLWFGDLFASG